MPTSAWHYISPILQKVYELHQDRPIRRVLDVGVGSGKWGFLSREVIDYYANAVYFRPDWRVRIEGIEAFDKYRTPVHDFVYDKIHWGDAVTLLRRGEDVVHDFDLIFIMEIIEHIEKSDGEWLLDFLITRAERAVILSFPPEIDAEGHHIFEQGATHGNPFETHRSIWNLRDIARFDPTEIAPQCFLIPGRARGVMVRAQQGASERERGIRLLQGVGSYVEYGLPRASREVEIQVLHHPWSSSLRVTSESDELGQVLDLFADSACIVTHTIRFMSPANSIRAEVLSNDRSQGQEAWVHSVRCR
jgi:hypothetical protein